MLKFLLNTGWVHLAKKLFFSLEKVDVDNTVDPTRVSTQDNSIRFSPSKRNNNVLCLEVNIQVLYHQLIKAHQQLIEPTLEISLESVLEMAIFMYNILLLTVDWHQL